MLCAHALGLNRSWWTVASQAASLCNFYASTWEEYHTGTLYLSAFSGPVEGILMICAIYLLTALHPAGQSLWSRPMISLIPGEIGEMAILGAKNLDKILGLKGSWRLERIPINVAFMLFGGLGTVGNIINRFVTFDARFPANFGYSYWNVVILRRKEKKPLFTPLLGYLPFLVHTLILLAWLQAELRGGVDIVHDARLLPFLGYWGMR